MPHLEDDSESYWYERRIPGRFYASRAFPQGGSARAAEVGPDVVLPACRFAYQKISDDGEVVFESDHGWEIVIRETPSGQQLKSIFFQDSREVESLTFQRFNSKGRRLDKESVSLFGEEVQILRNFLSLIGSQSLDLAEGEGVRLLPSGIEAVLVDEASRLELYRRYLPAIKELLEADVDAPEIISFARRRHQLQEFDQLLHDEEHFSEERRAMQVGGHAVGSERVWQRFFEANHWIFGTGLVPQFLHAFDPERLEQTAVGRSIFGAGKRPDAVMRTAGVLSALAFVEIKAHDTALLEREPYRSGTWSPGDHVVGGVAQCQVTVDEVVRQAHRALALSDEDGYRIGEALICRPRSILVVGSLEQFVREGNVHVERFDSFERFRRSIRDPEIVTFDELYERAAMSLALSGPDVGVAA